MKYEAGETVQVGIVRHPERKELRVEKDIAWKEARVIFSGIESVVVEVQTPAGKHRRAFTHDKVRRLNATAL